MAKISGTNLAAAIVPFTTEDTFATHLAQYGKGGWRAVETIADRDAITDQRLEVGMSVYVTSENKLYVLTALDTTTTPYTKTWEEFKSGSTDSVRKTASFDNFEPLINDEIVQYIGETNQNYTKGYFYKCNTTTTIENWVEFEPAESGSVCTCSFEDFKTFIESVDNIDPTSVVRGRIGAFYNSNRHDITLYNDTEFIKYFTLTFDEWTEAGFTFDPPLETGDRINFTCAIDKEVTTHTWEQINVQPHTNLVWGNITGTLSDQTDLQAALDSKSQVIFKLIVDEESD